MNTGARDPSHRPAAVVPDDATCVESLLVD